MKENRNKIKCDHKKFTSEHADALFVYIISVNKMLLIFISLYFAWKFDLFFFVIHSLFAQIEIKMLTHSDHLMHLRLNRNEIEIYATTKSASHSSKSQRQSSKPNFVQVKI